MTKEEVMAKLTKIFRDVFDDDNLVLTEDMTSDDIEGWDSLEHITILTAVENTFHFQFPIDRISNMKNIGELLDIILEMGSL